MIVSEIKLNIKEIITVCCYCLSVDCIIYCRAFFFEGYKFCRFCDFYVDKHEIYFIEKFYLVNCNMDIILHLVPLPQG